MPPSTLPTPSVGDSTKQAWAALVGSWISYLNSAISAASSGGGSLVPNGSFENDTDTDGIPDGWTETEYTAGAGSFDTSTPGHGASAYKFVTPGATGGGDLETTDFFPVSPVKSIIVDFLIKSTADIHNIVNLKWYTDAQVYISTTSIYDEETSNPTSWTRKIGSAIPPATARHAKLQVIGGLNDNSNSGTAYFDGITVTEGINDILIAYDSSGTLATGSIPTIGGVAPDYSINLGGFTADGGLGVSKGVDGGTTVACAHSYSGESASASLVLPEGTWTILAFGQSNNQDPSFGAAVLAIAIREY